MRRWLPVLVLLAGLSASPLASGACVTGDALFSHPELKTKSIAFQDYEIRFYSDLSCEAEPESRIAGFEVLKIGRAHV